MIFHVTILMFSIKGTLFCFLFGKKRSCIVVKLTSLLLLFVSAMRSRDRDCSVIVWHETRSPFLGWETTSAFFHKRGNEDRNGI